MAKNKGGDHKPGRHATGKGADVPRAGSGGPKPRADQLRMRGSNGNVLWALTKAVFGSKKQGR